MRSTLFTLLLLLVAVVSAGLAAVRITEGSLARVFGAPATPIGATLYDFDPAEVRDIFLAGNGVGAHCKLTANGWRIVSPWQDRMDPRVAQKLLDFTLNARVEGAIPSGKVESKQLGFEDGRIAIRIADAEDNPLAKFNLGHRTAWLGTDETTGEPIPTVYVQPRDRSRKDHYYAATDSHDIHAQLKDGLRRLRDHHPFLFHPNMVESVRIRKRGGELLLSCANPTKSWNIVKPLELRSNRESVIKLLQGLYDLEALTVRSRSELTLPAADPATIDQIALHFFGQEEEIVLEIHPPESPDSPTVLASISDRPNTIFELPRKSAAKDATVPVGLADLPLTVNELRDPILAAIDVRAVQAILISSATASEILIARERPEDRFKVRHGEQTLEANLTALGSLFTTITQGKAAAFVSDTVNNTAADLAPHGLDQPFLTLRFLNFDNSTLQVDFGEAADGSIHAMKAGTTTVMKIDPSLLALIPIKPWEWRHENLWSLSPPNIVGIERRIEGRPPVELQYSFFSEKWTAREGNRDRSAEIATDRASRMLDTLVHLTAENWLRANDETALQALATPSMVITILQKKFNDEGNLSGIERRELSVAPVTKGAESQRFYGRISGEPHPFLIPSDTVRKLAVDLFGFD